MKTPFKVGDLVAFENENCAYTVTVVEFMPSGNFIGKNPIYTKGRESSTSRKYVTDEFRLVKSFFARGKDGRFLGAKPTKTEPFTPDSIVAGAKYTNSRHPNVVYWGVCLGGRKIMLTEHGGREYAECLPLDANPKFWAAFSLKK